MGIINHYHKEKSRFLDNCLQCGLCADQCPILPLTDVASIDNREIQQKIFAFVNQTVPGPEAYTKAFACMECFKCTAGVCPQDLNPLLVNELIKADYVARGWADAGFGDPRSPDSTYRILAGILSSPKEYEVISRPRGHDKARLVFFPGCNIYYQPEKLLNALDIMDALGEDYSYLPGLDHCCGDSFFFMGDIEAGALRAEALVDALAAFEPEAVVFWCPTCLCRLDLTGRPAVSIPFEIMSFPQYLAANMDKLPLTGSAAGAVTLHEACKSAYTGLDPDGPRQVLRQLPGVELREMTRHGKDTICCGSGAGTWFPESCSRMRGERLQEAARTGANHLVTVCHYCHQTFVPAEAGYDFNVTSYVSLVAEALGIHREDRFKKYIKWGDLGRIVDDARDRIDNSPFERKRVIEVLRTTFCL